MLYTCTPVSVNLFNLTIETEHVNEKLIVTQLIRFEGVKLHMSSELGDFMKQLHK